MKSGQAKMRSARCGDALLIASNALLLSSIFCLVDLRAQEPESVWISNVTGIAVGDSLEPEEGRQRAKAQAYVQALQKLGVDFPADYLLRQSEAELSPDHLRRANDAFLLLLRSRSQGFITGTRNAHWTTRTTASGTEYSVTLDAKVTRPRGSPDYGFYVRLSTSRPRVLPGEEIRLEASPSRESFLYVFHILRDGVRLLYPAGPGGEIAMAAGGVMTIPPGDALPWQAALPEGWESSEELVVAIASRTQFHPEEAGVVDREGYRSAREGALVEILEWLARLPSGDVSDASVRIEVVRN
jgi:hypothetical protein